MEDCGSILSDEWQVVIFDIDGKANHVGLSIPDLGFADLSLLGARIITWDAPSLPKGEQLRFQLDVPSPEDAIAFLKRPGLLTSRIIEQEKASRGWHLTEEAPDFVRTFRNIRSRNPDDMNCVEWIVFALEIGGLEIPDDILTPTDLLVWCQNYQHEKCSAP